MHHALEIQEILLAIFTHCRPTGLPSRRNDSDLLALARTCRAFKEPALDVLWEALDDLSPLVRCLPEACLELSSENEAEEPCDLFAGNKYLFSRPPTQIEWDTLQSYTRRIRSIVEVKNRLDEECCRILANPPTVDSEPLFPNLRHLRCKYADEAIPLLHLRFPSLVSLDLVFGDVSTFQGYLASFPDLSPNIKRLCFRVRHLEDRLIKIEPNFISRWRDLHSVVCPQITLEADALAHLSRLPTLTRLTFKQIVTLPTFDAPLLFHTLRFLTIHSPSLPPISRLLSYMRLPTLTDLAAFIDSRPSKHDLASFTTTLHTSDAHTLERLTLDQSVPSMRAARGPDADVLGLPDLQPCMRLSRLRTLKINVEWDVRLVDDDVLALGLAWPRLEHFVINAYAGWHVHPGSSAGVSDNGNGNGNGSGSGGGGGVTLDGLSRLLETCRELRWLAIALDTRGYTALPFPRPWLCQDVSPTLPSPSPSPGPSPRLGSHRALSLNVLDSPIAAESVLAVAAYFGDVVPSPEVSLCAWRGSKMVRSEGWETHKARWENVFRWTHRRSAFLRHHLRKQNENASGERGEP